MKPSENEKKKAIEKFLGRHLLTDKQYMIYQINTVLLVGIFCLVASMGIWFNMSFDEKEFDINVDLNNSNFVDVSPPINNVPVTVDVHNNYTHEINPQIDVDVNLNESI